MTTRNSSLKALHNLSSHFLFCPTYYLVNHIKSQMSLECWVYCTHTCPPVLFSSFLDIFSRIQNMSGHTLFLVFRISLDTLFPGLSGHFLLETVFQDSEDVWTLFPGFRRCLDTISSLVFPYTPSSCRGTNGSFCRHPLVRPPPFGTIEVHTP